MTPFRDPKLSPKERVDDLLSRLTIDEKIGLLATHQSPVPRLGIGEWYVGQEVARGLVHREADRPTTVFPQAMGMAASFDPELMYEIGLTCSREARAYYNDSPDKKGGLMVWGPTVDLVHDPRWGRTEECYGEDPHLSATMATAYTLGMARDLDHPAVIPTLKHFCANSHEEDRLSDNANLNPRLKHEYYYAAFRGPILRGGAMSVMAAYNEICHVPAAMNHDLKDVLKGEWGLNFVVTDGEDFTQNMTHHQCCDSYAMALKACLDAGMDCFTDKVEIIHPAAKKALAEGLITEADIDRAIGNTLRSRVKLGHFDDSTPYDAFTIAKDVNTPADRALNRRAANEGMVLLENNGLLPYKKEELKTVALLGPNGDSNPRDWYTGQSRYQTSIKKGLEERGLEVHYDKGYDIVTLQAPNGKYVRVEGESLFADATADQASQFYLCVLDDNQTWVNFQSVETGGYIKMEETGRAILTKTSEIYGWFTYETFTIKPHTLHQGVTIASYLRGEQMVVKPDGGKVYFQRKARPGADTLFMIETISSGLARMQALAKEADAVIYCGGSDPMQVAKEERDRGTLHLPALQQQAVDALASLREDLLFVIVSSYPYALFYGEKRPAAVLWTCHAGPELGHALGDTIFGDNNPSGHTAITWYACDEDLPDKKDYDICATGSTYLWFQGQPLYPFGYGLSYSTFRRAVTALRQAEEGIEIDLEITNTSDADGTDVVQAYVAVPEATTPRPLQKLAAFKRVTVAAGATETMTLCIPCRELEFYSVALQRMVLESNTYRILLGQSSRDIYFTQDVEVAGETIPPRDLSAGIPAALYDAHRDTEIYTDMYTGDTYVRPDHWGGMVAYHHVDFTDSKAICLEASAPVETGCIKVAIDGESLGEITVPGCDGFWDFKEFSLPLEREGCHDIQVTLEKDTCVRSLQIRR